jgi:protein gp37
MGKTSIQWTDFSTNPIRARLKVGLVAQDNDRIGHYCEKVSPGCTNCYASRLQPRFGLPQFQEQRQMSDRIEPFLDRDKLDDVLRRRIPTKFFWEDMSDLFGRWVADAWIVECFAVMVLTPWHVHQVLTKRVDRMAALLQSQAFRDAVEHRVELLAMGAGPRFTLPKAIWPPANIWIGFSAERQHEYDTRSAQIRPLFDADWFTWASFEPLLGPIALGLPAPIGWGVIGLESGQKARPGEIDWIRQLVAGCRGLGILPFVKQLGRRPMAYLPVVGTNDQTLAPLTLVDLKGGEPAEWPEDLRVREMPGLPL